MSANIWRLFVHEASRSRGKGAKRPRFGTEHRFAQQGRFDSRSSIAFSPSRGGPPKRRAKETAQRRRPTAAHSLSRFLGTDAHSAAGSLVNRKIICSLWHLERLHSLYLWRPERHFFPVLPFHGDAGGRAYSPHRVVLLVPGQLAAGAHVLHLLDHRHQLVGVQRARFFDGVLDDVDAVIGGGGIGGRFLVPLLEGLDEGHCLGRHFHFGIGVQGGNELALARGGAPELV